MDELYELAAEVEQLTDDAFGIGSPDWTAMVDEVAADLWELADATDEDPET